jgi:hypothetical protein
MASVKEEQKLQKLIKENSFLLGQRIMSFNQEISEVKKEYYRVSNNLIKKLYAHLENNRNCKSDENVSEQLRDVIDQMEMN